MTASGAYEKGSRYLVLGASGVLGSRLLEFLSRRCEVTGTYHTRQIPGCAQFDLRDDKELRRVLDAAGPTVILHAAGMTRPDECEANRDAAYQVNVEGVRLLAEAAGSAKIIFFSTDYVFDGKRGSYTEDDVPNPINQYGRTKLAAERELLRRRPESLVVRVAGLFGVSHWNTEFTSTLSGGHPLRLSGENVSSYTFIDDICRYLPRLRNASGVVHLVGPDSFSRADFARLACARLGISAEVVSVPAAVAYPDVARPLNSSLVSSRLRLSMTPARQALDELRRSLGAAGARGGRP